jgi:glycerol kinase
MDEGEAMTNQFILALDQGTTSSRAAVFDHGGNLISIAQKEFQQIYPQPGWVEHDPQEIWSTQAGVAAEALTKIGLHSDHAIAAIGISNQRETTIVWERATGKPIYNAIVWQDRRTADFCAELKERGAESMIRSKTGLPLDAYFSATKIHWILNHVPGAKQRAERGELAFGTVDSWLVWNFTQRESHVTDVTNASRTLLFNIHTLEWDDELLALFEIPRSLLPQVHSSSELVGTAKSTVFAAPIPITGIAGDQHAALFGQMCTEAGMAKNTYGTGCFLVMNTGNQAIISRNNLLTTLAWKIGGQATYALEGSIFIGGAVVQWLRDGLGLIPNSAAIENLANQVTDSNGVVIVPAFAGLGAPYWNPYACGAIYGLTRGASAAHLARAALESIAFQSYDVLKAMEADLGGKITELRVDGGAVSNNLLMQFQADLLQTEVVRPQLTETTVLGAAYLAGLAVGYWGSIDELKQQWKQDRRFMPVQEDGNLRNKKMEWLRAVKASIAWASS